VPWTATGARHAGIERNRRAGGARARARCSATAISDAEAATLNARRSPGTPRASRSA
jgi:hypothetical protein